MTNKKCNYNEFVELLIRKSEKEISELNDVVGILDIIKENFFIQWIVDHKVEFRLFMNDLFNSSLHVEEGRQVCIRVALGLPSIPPNVEFISPLTFTSEKIVKIAPSINLWDRQLLIKPDESGHLKIFGFIQRPCDWDSIGRKSSSSHSTALVNKMEWDILTNSEKLCFARIIAQFLSLNSGNDEIEIKSVDQTCLAKYSHSEGLENQPA